MREAHNKTFWSHYSDIDYIHHNTALSKFLVRQYEDIIHHENN